METTQEVLCLLITLSIILIRSFHERISDAGQEQPKTCLSRVNFLLSPINFHMVEQALTQFVGLDEALEALDEVTTKTSAVSFDTSISNLAFDNDG